MCIKNKNYMENWLFWGLNLGNLKQCMMIMLVLTSSSSAWTLCSLLHISSLINICNFYSFWATGMVLTSKWGRILQEIHCQCQIWLKWSAAGRRPANFHKRNYLLSVNTTDFEKTTIQAHSAMLASPSLSALLVATCTSPPSLTSMVVTILAFRCDAILVEIFGSQSWQSTLVLFIKAQVQCSSPSLLTVGLQNRVQSVMLIVFEEVPTITHLITISKGNLFVHLMIHYVLSRILV